MSEATCRRNFMEIWSACKCVILPLKSHELDICRHISAADGHKQIKFLNHSEVKFVCACLLLFRTWVRHWSLCGKIWISHWPILNVQMPSHSQSLRQSLCGRVGEHPIACGDWLACQTTTSVCNNHIIRTAQILSSAFCAYVCSDVTRMAILNWGPFGRLDPRPCSLARWTRTLCIQRHIVLEGVMGINITPLVSMPCCSWRMWDFKTMSLKLAE